MQTSVRGSLIHLKKNFSFKVKDKAFKLSICDNINF